MMIPVLILRVDGSRVSVSVPKANVWAAIEKEIGASCLDGVDLRNGTTMFVDDNGYEAETISSPGYIQLVCTKPRKPVNIAATKLYHSVCVPGTVHRIVGDVAIVSDSDFSDSDE